MFELRATPPEKSAHGVEKPRDSPPAYDSCDSNPPVVSFTGASAKRYPRLYLANTPWGVAEMRSGRPSPLTSASPSWIGAVAGLESDGTWLSWSAYVFVGSPIVPAAGGSTPSDAFGLVQLMFKSAPTPTPPPESSASLP